jgi:hypothetical protein
MHFAAAPPHHEAKLLGKSDGYLKVPVTAQRRTEGKLDGIELGCVLGVALGDWALHWGSDSVANWDFRGEWRLQ